MVCLKKLALVVFLAAFLMFGCTGLMGQEQYSGNGGSGYSGAKTASLSPSSQSSSYSLESSDSSYASTVTKESSMTLKVSEGTLESKINDTTARLQAEGAEISNVYYDEYSDRKQYTLTVKVIPSKFETINSILKQTGEVKDMSVQLEDVTKEYTDLDTRIKNKETELQRLYALYNQSSNVSDLIDVEREVTRVETELELLKQQKQALISKIEKATINVSIYEEKPATQQFSVSLENLGGLFFGALAVAVMLIVAAIGFLLPVAIVLGGLWLGYKKFFAEKKIRPR